MRPKNLVFPCLASLALLFALPACAAESPSPISPTLPSGPLDADSLPLPEGAVISYQRIGGIAGLDETWLIYADGRIVDPQGREQRVEPEQVQRLLENLNATGFFALDPAYQPENPCCDRFTYILTVRYQTGANRMTAVDGVESVPPQLWTCLEKVYAFLREHSP